MTESNVRIVLLDIEGTTTPIDFVYQTLFPFVRRNLEQFLLRQISTASVREDIAALRVECEMEFAQSGQSPQWSDSDIESAVRHALWLMDQDRKSTALKALQGRIWEEGYLSGELHGIVFGDVPRAFERWKVEGRKIAIYSSGSILAQKLIFGHSNAGDLTRFIDSYFDTTTGPKREAESYRRIAGAMGIAASEVLFYSDVTAELDAARAAGMQTALCVRDGGTVTADDHPVVTTFDII
ncbi:MAG: acireductone synthase [Acidobacteriota bacterium]